MNLTPTGRGPRKMPRRIITNTMSDNEKIEVLKDDLESNIEPKAWRKHILLNSKVRQKPDSAFPCVVETLGTQFKTYLIIN